MNPSVILESLAMRHDVPRSALALLARYRAGIQARARSILARRGGMMPAKLLAELVGVSPHAIDGYLCRCRGVRKCFPPASPGERPATWYALEQPPGGAMPLDEA